MSFFAVGIPQFRTASELGMPEALCLLVLACGTGRDHLTSKWSAKACQKYAGLHHSFASRAISNLADAGILVIEGTSQRPRYKLQKPSEPNDLVWLDNRLVFDQDDGVSPLRKIRESQSVDALRLLIELNYVQGTGPFGGIPTDVLHGAEFDIEELGESGQFNVFIFRAPDAYYTWEPLSPALAWLSGSPDRARNALKLLFDLRLLYVESEPLLIAGGQYPELLAQVNFSHEDVLPEYMQHRAGGDILLKIPRHISDPILIKPVRTTHAAGTDLLKDWLKLREQATQNFIRGQEI